MNSNSLASQTVHVLYFDIRHTEDWERGDALSEPAAAGSTRADAGGPPPLRLYHVTCTVNPPCVP